MTNEAHKMSEHNTGEHEKERENWEGKKERLFALLRGYAAEDAAVAFSGGADSSLLLLLACKAAEVSGKKVYALTVQTRLHPSAEIADAERTAAQIGARHQVIAVDELLEAGIGDNPVNRCYLCKKLLFTRMRERAGELGAAVILEGTNEDDLHRYRPGLKALAELDIVSPLAEAGFTKREVRRLAAEYDLAAGERPATPCLATRFPYGVRLSGEALARVEAGEAFLKSFGFYNVRLRVHGDIARIEVNLEELPAVLLHREEIVRYLQKLGYPYVTLDLEGFRSGSMDIS